jgi:uncharacterized protein CbrC (UPF0167 family)
MSTFAELGIPFPLYEGPVADAGQYVGRRTCHFCGNADRHCFRLGIGDYLMAACPACGAQNGLSADERAAVKCRKCAVEIALPIPSGCEEIRVCYECLRDGKVALAKDTEFGMVTWEQALEGRTRGVPGLQTDQFETVPINAEEDWYAARVPEAHLWELLRTPTFNTWQGEQWLFCCKQPMTYVGNWNDLAKPGQSRDELRELFDSLSLDDEIKDLAWEGIECGSSSVCIYVFRCRACGRRQASWDMD